MNYREVKEQQARSRRRWNLIAFALFFFIPPAGVGVFIANKLDILPNIGGSVDLKKSIQELSDLKGPVNKPVAEVPEQKKHVNGMPKHGALITAIGAIVAAMGVVGAAIGTGLAELITALAMLYFAAVRSPELNLLQDRGSFRPTAKVLSKAAGIGGPMALQNALIRGGYIASTIIVAPLGTIAIAANSFAITAESFCYMPGYGIADAATALVGQSVGAGRKELAQRFGWITTGLAMAIMSFLAVLMYIFAPQIMTLLTPDAEVISLGVRVLRIEAFAEMGYAASIVAYGAFVGAGDTKWPSVMNFTSMWIVRLLPAFFLVKVYGLVGFWIAMAVELTFRGTIFLVRLARGKWLEQA